ncbi:hypothetical protein P170DRAFT_272493 [Aspergillus steynii IBT 23096]|uniref:Uncharacterized protein n=1 Tax=Aspergillus steynii IBT 23096 TaxID=1392250 RepID=A0A2I2FWU9_9EURO|nr:uncharacterized protein P170DRAFT_272493 [Aspergillus steynii IBT 23096]PLB45098.1 hypothetical protein P170DRAFT_272493 [Aspergillus steynii IBT 23096]
MPISGGGILDSAALGRMGRMYDDRNFGRSPLPLLRTTSQLLCIRSRNSIRIPAATDLATRWVDAVCPQGWQPTTDVASHHSRKFGSYDVISEAELSPSTTKIFLSVMHYEIIGFWGEAWALGGGNNLCNVAFLFIYLFWIWFVQQRAASHNVESSIVLISSRSGVRSIISRLPFR